MIKQSKGTIRVTVSSDEMKAYAEIRPPRYGGKPAGVAELQQALHDSGVLHGIKDELYLKRYVRTGETKPVVFTAAEGTPPVDGRDASIDCLWKFRPRTHRRDSGNIDLHELESVQAVLENETIAGKTPPAPGVDGKTVTGKMLLARAGVERHFRAGKNVIARDNGHTFVATASGAPSLDGNVINVSPLMEISGNIDFSVGNIDFPGSVIIHGDVPDGFCVKAEGDIIIGGHVDAATVTAGGDIVARGGITTRFRGFVSAGGSVTAKYISNSIVEAEKDIVVHREITNSIARANGSVRCTAAGGRIIGGDIMARHEILASHLGGPAETVTTLRLGHNFKAYMIICELEQKVSALDAQLKDLYIRIAAHTRLSSEPIESLQRKYDAAEQERDNLAQEVFFLRESAPFNSSALVRCPDTINPLTVFFFGDKYRKTTSAVKHASVVLDEFGDIHFTLLKNDGEAAKAAEETPDNRWTLGTSDNSIEKKIFNAVIADGSAAARENLREILQFHNFEVVGEASCGEQAVELCKQNAPDIVVLDLLLAGPDCISAIEGILAHTPCAKIVVTAGAAHGDMIQRAIAAGAASFVLKPFRVRDTIATLNRVATQSASRDGCPKTA